MQFKSMTIDGIQYHIKRLKSMGLLKRIGPDKGGYWQVMGHRDRYIGSLFRTSEPVTMIPDRHMRRPEIVEKIRKAMSVVPPPACPKTPLFQRITED